MIYDNVLHRRTVCKDVGGTRLLKTKQDVTSSISDEGVVQVISLFGRKVKRRIFRVGIALLPSLFDMMYSSIILFRSS